MTPKRLTAVKGWFRHTQMAAVLTERKIQGTNHKCSDLLNKFFQPLVMSIFVDIIYPQINHILYVPTCQQTPDVYK